MSIAIIFVVDGEQEVAAQWPEIPHIGEQISFFHDIYADDGIFVSKTINASFRVSDVTKRSQVYNFNQEDGPFYAGPPQIKVFLETETDRLGIIHHLQKPKV